MNEKRGEKWITRERGRKRERNSGSEGAVKQGRGSWVVPHIQGCKASSFGACE